MAERFVRMHGTPLTDNRTAPQIDRDRVMYTSAFRRLANVTQVVSADDVHVFHNRLTHSLQVAQVARRSAEFLQSKNANVVKYVDPDVCETAALAHDIGHPPFGHLAEVALDRLAKENELRDGFEGNAQSFRIITKLAALDTSCDGLDLTRATLNAVLKYPWLFEGNNKNLKKWGAYDSEKDEFSWARELLPVGSVEQCLEAQIMDWADDVTYSVHDVEDFYKAGLIPLERLSSNKRERQKFYDEVFQREKEFLPTSEKELKQIFENLSGLWGDFEPYAGHHLQRNTLKMAASKLIGDFVRCIDVDLQHDDICTVQIDQAKKHEVFMLKQLTWHYVILNPALTSQQRGQRLVIEGLFAIYLEAINADDFSIFPTIYREKLADQLNHGHKNSELIRTVIDMIASMTESQAIHIYHRLNGTALGSFLTYPVG